MGLRRFASTCLAALAFGALPYSAAAQSAVDLNDEAEASARQALAIAEPLDQRLMNIGRTMDDLAAKGGARAGGGDALAEAAKAFGRIPELRQISAFGTDGKTFWATRPANRGRVLFPDVGDIAAADFDPGVMRIFPPVEADSHGVAWRPVAKAVTDVGSGGTAVIVAFMKDEDLAAGIDDAEAMAALFDMGGMLVGASGAGRAQVGQSFADAPGFLHIAGTAADAGAYLGAAGEDGTESVMVGFRRLACCDAFLTVASTAALDLPPASPSAPSPGRWLALAALGLATLTALGILGRRVFADAPDPWRDFGDKRQPLA